MSLTAHEECGKSPSTMESVPCNCCGSNDLRLVYRQPDPLFFTDEWFDAVECRACGLGFINPRPDPEEIGKYYPRDFYSAFEDKSYHAKRYAAEAAYLPDPDDFDEPPLLLDVGCADGDFPRFMVSRGWNVEGVEPSKNAAPVEDFPVYRMPLPEIPVDEPRYDAVTAWAVIEHVHDPRAYFQKVARILKPGGTFAFLVTNFESLSSRALFREDPPRHLYFFTPSTVARYMADAGLTLETAEQNRAIYPMVPANVLFYAIHRFLLRRPFEWPNVPESRDAYMRRTGRRPGLATTLTYLAGHPLVGADRLVAAIYERWQLLRGTYGIAVYVARKPK